MAQVIARVARPADEEAWLVEARHRTVRQMRTLVEERSASGQMFATEEGKVTLTVTIDREAEWLFEGARMLARQIDGDSLEQTLDALLAEGTTSLLAQMDRMSVVAFDETQDEHAAQRSWESELARFQEEAEARCEAAMGERMRAHQGNSTSPAHSASDAEAPERAWDGDAEFIDAQLRCVSTELAQRDLVIGDLAEALWNADGWRRLGYATESQYARERLGMSLSAVKAKRALARRTRTLPQLREAVNARALGYETARLVAAVASPETAEAWMERARERTVKHLREEVDAAEMLGRIGVDPKLGPPSEATMEKLAGLERRIVAGPALQQDERQISASVDKTDESVAEDIDRSTPSAWKGELRARGRVTLRFHVSVGTRRYYRWLEFESDCGNQGLEPLRATGKRCVTRKHEIVGVARVDCARRTRSSGNPRIETIRREIREGRRCRGTLGGVTVHQTPASADACGERALVPVLGKAGVRDRIENTFRDLESAQPGQNARHDFWIAESAKNTVDTCGADRRKELFQVHA
jgi:hypothetical protein